MKRFLLLLLLLLMVVGFATARKTAKEWASFNAAAEADDDDDEQEKKEDKYGLIRVTFGSQYNQHDRFLTSKTWHEQMLGDGLEIKVYGGGEDSMIVASKEFGQVWQYFLSHIADMPTVMKVSMDDEGRVNSEIWNLPKYQKEYDLDSQSMNARKVTPEDLLEPAEPESFRQEI